MGTSTEAGRGRGGWPAWRRGRAAAVAGVVFAWSAVACGLPAPAPATPGPERAESALRAAIPNPVYAGTLEQAVAESVRRSRVLFLFVYDDQQPDLVEKMWRAPSIASWVHWHGLVWVTPRSAAPLELSRWIKDADAVTYVVVEGAVDVMWFHMSVGALGDRVRESEGTRVPFGVASREIPIASNPLATLLQADMALERFKATRPVWADRHDRDNPPPPRPPDEDVFAPRDDGVAQPYDGPPNLPPPAVVPEPGSGRPFSAPPRPEFAPGAMIEPALAVLDEARAMAASGDFWSAAGRYTWLWETGLRDDPGLAPLRCSALANEVRRHAGRASVGERFTAVRNGMTRQLLWFDPPELDEWLVLNDIVGDTEMMLQHGLIFLVDPYEDSLTPAAEQANIRAMHSRLDLLPRADPPGRLAPALAKLAKMAHRIEDGQAPQPARKEEWAESRVFRRGVVVSEAVGIVARALEAGDEEVARRAGELAAKVGGPNGALAAAVAVAWSGKSLPAAAGWIEQAEVAGAEATALRARLGMAARRVEP